MLAASYEAKAKGVRSPMPHREALALAPFAITQPPRFDAYMEASRRVFEIFRDTTPLVEGLSVDEAFLDVGGLLRLTGTPEQVGALLRRRGYAVSDHHLTTRAETDAFKAKHDVQSTPQTFIGGKRIGGYDDLVRFFGGKVEDKDAVTYKPVIALFAMTALMALAATAVE